MKGLAAFDPCGSCHDNDRQTTKLPCLDGLKGTTSALWDGYDEQVNPQQHSSPLSPGIDRAKDLEYRRTALLSTGRQNEIFCWIPRPSGVVHEFNTMDRPPCKRLRSRSISDGLVESLSSPEESLWPWSTSSADYHDLYYVMKLEEKNCFMNGSKAGPTTEDIEFCMRLLSQEVATPQNTIFDDELAWYFRRTLCGQSEVGLLMGLHALLMPSVQEEYLKEKENRDRLQHLEHVVDGYNDLWVNAEPICGPRPKPSHARGLGRRFFSDSERRKLKIKPNGLSPYAMRDNMWFPYLTAEVKGAVKPLQVADRQNMHSMCIALRALVSLAQAAGQPEKLHRRVLGFLSLTTWTTCLFTLTILKSIRERWHITAGNLQTTSAFGRINGLVIASWRISIVNSFLFTSV